MLTKAPLFILCLLLSSIVGISGCAFVDLQQETRYEFQANPLTNALLKQIELGKTSQTWVENHIGLPSTSSANADGSTVYRYHVEAHRTRKQHVMFLFRHRSDDITPRYLNLTFRRGVVTDIASDFLTVPKSPTATVTKNKSSAQPIETNQASLDTASMMPGKTSSTSVSTPKEEAPVSPALAEDSKANDTSSRAPSVDTSSTTPSSVSAGAAVNDPPPIVPVETAPSANESPAE